MKTQQITVNGKLTSSLNPDFRKIEYFFYCFEKTEKYILKVVDLIGNVIINEANTSLEGENLKEIDLSSVSKGMYFFDFRKRRRKNQKRKGLLCNKKLS